MAEHSPAPPLGALTLHQRERLDANLRHYENTDWVEVPSGDLRALLNAYDRQALIVAAAEEIAVLWPFDPKLWVWEEVEALVAAVTARGAVGAGEHDGA